MPIRSKLLFISCAPLGADGTAVGAGIAVDPGAAVATGAALEGGSVAVVGGTFSGGAYRGSSAGARVAAGAGCEVSSGAGSVGAYAGKRRTCARAANSAAAAIAATSVRLDTRDARCAFTSLKRNDANCRNVAY